MAHDDPAVGKPIEAEWGLHLDEYGFYEPELTAVTTNPNLGSDGSVDGLWHRSGHLITAWFTINFSGTGMAQGSGIYEVSLPYAADTGVHPTTTLSPGGHSRLGSGGLRSSATTGSENRTLVWFLASSTQIRAGMDQSRSVLSDSTAGANTRIVSGTIHYIASDPVTLL